MQHRLLIVITILIVAVMAGAAPVAAEKKRLMSPDEVLRLMQRNPKDFDESLHLLPVMLTRPLEAPNRLVFIWRHECLPCVEAFRAHVWGLMSKEDRRRRIVTFVIQHETQPTRIQHVVDLMCASPDRWAWHAFNHLLSRTNAGKEPEFPRGLDGTTGNAKSTLCSNKKIARKHIEVFMKEIGAGYSVSTLPIVLLNGKRITSPYAELDSLQ